MSPILVWGLYRHDKIAKESNLRKSFSSSQFEGTYNMARKAWQWKCEASGHISSTVGKQAEMILGPFPLWLDPSSMG